MSTEHKDKPIFYDPFELPEDTTKTCYHKVDVLSATGVESGKIWFFCENCQVGRGSLIVNSIDIKWE